MRIHRARPALLAALALLSGCQAQEKLGPPTPGVPADVEGYAYYLTIDVEAGTVQVTPPARQGVGQPGTGLAYSLMGNDIVTLTTSNVYRSPVGVGGANKRKITFDLALTNKLSVSDLVTPTFPLPPGGATGILAFPYTVTPTGVVGGKVTASADWNGTGAAGSGAPANFFNDFGSCGTAATSDCYRWEMFPAPLTPGATTPAQKVGFVVDAGVTTVGVYVVVAADLLDHPPPPPQPGRGTLVGGVTSSLGGALPGATITLTPGGSTTVTDGIGVYAFADLAPGSYTVSVSNLPANCTAPAPASVAVTSGGIAHADIVVPCLPTYGTVSGLVKILNVQPGGGVAADPLPWHIVHLGGQTGLTDDAGAYQITGVPLGSYSITPANFPTLANCTLQAPVTITVGSAQVTAPTITVVCFQELTVTVTDRTTRVPLSGIPVSVSGNGTVASGTTDQVGAYLTGPLQTGYYTVSVSIGAGCRLIGPPSPLLLTTMAAQTADYLVDCPATTSATIVATIGGTSLVPTPLGVDWASVGQIEARDASGNVIGIGGWDPTYMSLAVTLPAPGVYQVQAFPGGDSPFPAAMGCVSDIVTVTVPAGGGGLGVNLTVTCPNGAAWGVVTLDGAPDLTDLVVVIDPSNPSPPFWTITPALSGSYAIYVVGMPANRPAELYIVDPVGPNRTCQPVVPTLTVPAVQFVQQNFACVSQ